jgi:hypothetical protein
MLTKAATFRLTLALVKNLTLGYNRDMTDVSKAASLMGRRSAEARIKQWGKAGFERRLREWGKLGGRPRNTKKGERR